ncbi:unnamed protein product [Microthlaspi erraticum]|uniref:Uncharacterized protein n=1 Tax=Microthlaspi erraticum TaxID=1685480 RepID=A0A6D2HEU3_9BRAS|nr:unnamed protein product [Microthlaspi erraticum]
MSWGAIVGPGFPSRNPAHKAHHLSPKVKISPLRPSKSDLEPTKYPCPKSSCLLSELLVKTKSSSSSTESSPQAEFERVKRESRFDVQIRK